MAVITEVDSYKWFSSLLLIKLLTVFWLSLHLLMFTCQVHVVQGLGRPATVHADCSPTAWFSTGGHQHVLRQGKV